MEAQWQNFSEFVRQEVGQFTEDKTWFENNAPSYEALQKFTDDVPFTDKGYQLPAIVQRSGGDTWYVPSASSFNQTVSPDSKSMYVYPAQYAKPMVFEGNLIDSLNSASSRGMSLLTFNNILNQYMDDAIKRLEFAATGDGSGARAYSSSTLSSTGSGQTMNCTTSAATTPGQTKGAIRLYRNHTYQAINTSTNAIRGTILVETEGTSSCVVNVISGSVSANDAIVDVGGWQKCMRGLGWLISKTSRILQQLDTANYPELNSPEVDLQGSLCTPADFDNAKTMLQTRNNSETAENKLLCFLTFGFYSKLKQQGWNLTIQDMAVTHGVAKKFVDGDTMFIRSADMDDDRAYFAHPDFVKMFELRKLDTLKLDGNEMRMVMGDNGTGSDDWQRALGVKANPGITRPRACALIKRAQTGVTQVSSY